MLDLQRALAALTAAVVIVGSGAAPPDPPAAGPVVRVVSSYPGADARVVADTVTAPLLNQLDGTEGAVRTEAVSRNDGSCEIVVRFGPKADRGAAWVRVRNRVALAEPLLPAVVRRLGVSIETRDPERLPAVWVVVRGGPGADPLLAAHVARTVVTDSLARVVGVEAVAADGPDLRLRATLDPDKLAARTLTTTDVTAALEKQNLRVEVAAGAPVLTLQSSARALDAEAAAGIILRVAAGGAATRLGDVARVEPVATASGFVLLNGEPVGLVRVTGIPGAAVAGPVVKAVAAIGKNLPPGVSAETFADLTAAAPGFAWVELRLPTGAGPGRTRTATEGAVKRVRELPGRPDCLAVGGAAPDRATLLVKLPPKDVPTPADLRKALAGLPELTARVTDVTAGRTPFPVRVALSGEGSADLRRWADAVVKRLNADEIATDADVWPRGDSTSVSVNVDRKKAAALGVKIDDLTAVLESAAGLSVDATADMKRVEIPGANGKRVPLGAVASFEMVTRPEAIWQLGAHAGLKIMANPPPGQMPAAAAARCVRVAEEEKKRLKLPAGFRVADLTAADLR